MLCSWGWILFYIMKYLDLKVKQNHRCYWIDSRLTLRNIIEDRIFKIIPSRKLFTVLTIVLWLLSMKNNFRSVMFLYKTSEEKKRKRCGAILYWRRVSLIIIYLHNIFTIRFLFVYTSHHKLVHNSLRDSNSIRISTQYYLLQFVRYFKLYIYTPRLRLQCKSFI